MRVPRRDTGRYRWVILGVGVLSQSAFSAVSQGLPSLGPALRQELELSLSQIGVVFAAPSWGVMVTLLAWGWLADRFGERVVLSTGLAGAAAGLAAAAGATSYAGLLLALVLVGALGGATTIASGSAVIGWFARDQRGLALGVRQMALPLGGAVAALVLPVAVARGGLEAAFRALAAGAAVGALAAALWVREPPAQPPGGRRPDRPTPLHDRRVWRLSLGSALLISGQVAIVSFVVLFLHDARSVSASAAAAALATIQVGGAVARLVAGRWSDVTGRRMAPLRQLALATALAIAAAGALTTAPLAVTVAVLLAAGILSMSWNGLSLTAIAELSGRRRAGTAIGLQQTVMRGLSTATGVGFGAFVAATSWGIAFAALAALPLAGWWVMRPLVAEEDERRAVRDPLGGTSRPLV